MSYDNKWQLPSIVYALGAALCLGGAGGSCEHWSPDARSGNFTPTAVGICLGFVLMAVFFIIRGLQRWHD